MTTEEAPASSRFSVPQPHAHITVGDVVRLDIPGDDRARMTVVEVVRLRGRALVCRRGRRPQRRDVRCAPPRSCIGPWSGLTVR